MPHNYMEIEKVFNFTSLDSVSFSLFVFLSVVYILGGVDG